MAAIAIVGFGCARFEQTSRRVRGVAVQIVFGTLIIEKLVSAATPGAASFVWRGLAAFQI